MCALTSHRRTDLAAPHVDQDNSEAAARGRLDEGLSGGDSLLVSIDVYLSAKEEVGDRENQNGREDWPAMGKWDWESQGGWSREAQDSIGLGRRV